MTLRSSFLGWILLGCATLAAALPDKPNIVFILADDLGWTDLGFQGSRFYETPHIDRLAKRGARFTNFCVSQNCAPTRACLMSGQYAPRTGIYTVSTLERGRPEDRAMNVPHNETHLPLRLKTVADVLQQEGYATGLFGKWHLGRNGAFHPARRGFDEAIVSTGRSHFKFTTVPPTDVPEDVYLADHLTDLGLRFIENHRDEPFFLYLPHFGVHSPYQAKQSWIDHFEKRQPVGNHRNPTYAAMIASIDDSVGRVVAKLDELNLDDRTLVIFSSDNGGVGGYDRTEPPSARRGITDNAPLRGGKGTLYEGGLRVPFIARWPGVVPAGSICRTPAAHVDLFPTLIELAGANPPRDQLLDGISLVTLLENPGAELTRPPLFWHFPGYLESYVHPRGWRTAPVSVIRDGPWKLMEFLEDGRLELYHLGRDTGERNDLSASRPEQRDRLHRALQDWRNSVHAAMPTRKNP